MKTLLLTLALMAALVRSGYAAEYRTLRQNALSMQVPASSVIKITGIVGAGNGNGLRLTFADGTEINFDISNSMVGHEFSGLTKVENYAPSYSAPAIVTLQITHANELNVVAPTSLLVIPENSTGNYNIVVETSSDTATWTPFHSQTVSANDAKRFFRTRIVKAE